jgi:hypothetical protein
MYTIPEDMELVMLSPVKVYRKILPDSNNNNHTNKYHWCDEEGKLIAEGQDSIELAIKAYHEYKNK